MSTIERLQPLIGRWETRMSFTPEYGMDEVVGSTEFAWLLGGAFVLQTSDGGDAKVPSGHVIIAEDGDDFEQHYFDSRGVVRFLKMTFDGTTLSLLREPDPPDFHQRMTVRFDQSGDMLSGNGDMLENGAWRHDFDITYTRLQASHRVR